MTTTTFNQLQDDMVFMKEISIAGVEGLFLLERGYTEIEVIEILQSFKHREYMEKEIKQMSLKEREVFYTWHCGIPRDGLLI